MPLTCPFCGGFDESLIHLFAKCVAITARWRTLGIQNAVADCVVVTDSANSYLFGVLNGLDGDARLAWGMTLWSIWTTRNQLVWNNIRDSTTTMIMCGNQYLVEWLVARSSPLRVNPPPHPSISSPLVDVAFDWEVIRLGLGCASEMTMGSS